MSSHRGETSAAAARDNVAADDEAMSRDSEDEVADLTSLSSLSEMSSEDDDDDDEDEDEDDDDDDNETLPYSRTRRKLRDSLLDDSRVTMTPHRPKLSGRPLRKTAAVASQAWSGESQSRSEPVLLSTPSKGKGKEKRLRSPEQTPTKATPTTKRVRVLETPEQHKNSARKAAEQTPTRRTTARAVVERKRMREDSDDGDVLGAASLIQPTSSDAYFVNLAPRATRAARNQTSDILISRTVHGGGLAARTIVSMAKHFAKQLQDGSKSDAGNAPAVVAPQSFDRFHEHWWSLLTAAHRPMLFYGVGSKRAALQRFARRMAAQARCQVIVVRGEAGGRVEEIVSLLERSCGVAAATDVGRVKRSAAVNGLEARVRHLVDVLHERHQSIGVNKKAKKATVSAPAFLLLIHNIEASTLLQEKSLRTLGLLAHAPNVYLCAETSHLNAAMLAGLDGGSDAQEALRWLWIDMTTYVPPLDEIIGERGAGIGKTLGLPAVLDVRRAGAGSDGAVASLDYNIGSSSLMRNGVGGHDAGSHRLHDASGSAQAAALALLSDRAAIHILQSVTFKARRLFLLLATSLLSERDEEDDEYDDPHELNTVSFNALADLARINFLAMTPDALRALLVEFTSHGLIAVTDTSVVSVAMSSADLRHVVDTFVTANASS